ncbi:putative solute carrier family 22 member 31 isoform X2 [Trachemys scripta elegans]|uniref:putative solute carrier family 22 member 31 isoform X2 n=1 Tax=Trachemys scripta elegans TaxID=31138 RepID=UPI001552E656|nr:putative solute carrier family 22 member 31 isoform X2 [Trachemys scripta elegans]
MEFDARLLRPAGGFGRRARLLAAATWAPNAALALGFFAGLLLAAPPAHRCRPDPALLPPALRNLSGRALLNASVPRGAAGWSRCLLYRYLPGAAGPNRTGPCTRGWDYELPAAGLRSSLVTQWDLVCSDRWKVPLEQTTYLLGWLSGCIALGLACDRFGRRATFVFSLVLAVPLGIGVALALNYMMLLSLRLLLGAALAGTFLSLYVARLELCDPPHRLMVVMVAGFFWVAGELLLPGLAVLCRQWRLLQGAVTLTLALLATCWGCPSLFPESPRWLLATRQLEKGRKGLRALAEGNGVSLEDEFYSQEHLLAELESDGVPLPRYHTLCEVFSTRVIWKNSLILGFTASTGLDHPDPLCPGHRVLASCHHAQHLLCQRGPSHRGQGRWAGPHHGCQLRGQSGRAHHGHPEQPGLLPAPRGLCLLRHPLRAQHHAAAREQGQGPARVAAGRGESAPAPALPLLPPQGPAASALAPQRRPRPRGPGLRPPRHCHQEDAELPPACPPAGQAAAAGARPGG